MYAPRGREIRLAAAIVVSVVVVALTGPHGIGTAAAKRRAPAKVAPVAPDMAAAKQAFEEGLRAFNLSHWQEAIAAFEKSYKLSGDPALLFNVAQASRQAGNADAAIGAYKAFLREKPDTPQREMVEAKIRELQSKKAQPEVLAAPRQEDLENPFAPAPAATAAPAASEAATIPGPAAPASTQSAAPTATEPPAAPAGAAPFAVPVAGNPSSPREMAGHDGPEVPKAEGAPRRDLSLASTEKPTAREVKGGMGPWWVWAGGAAIVAGAIAAAIIIATRPPGRDLNCGTGVDACLPLGN